jgi:AcrR family transcriptional regulator
MKKEKTEEKKITLRRAPQQERGQLRVNKILDTATKLFAKVGYELTTTNEIAAVAEVPIGSIYQFFSNKEAILQAVSERYRSEMRSLFDIIIKEEWSNLPSMELASRIIDAIVEFDRSHIAFQQIFLDARMGTLVGAEKLHNEIIERIDYGYKMRFPHLSLELRHLFAIISLTMIKSLISTAHDYEDKMKEHIILETKIVLATYFDHVGQEELNFIKNTNRP